MRKVIPVSKVIQVLLMASGMAAHLVSRRLTRSARVIPFAFKATINPA